MTDSRPNVVAWANYFAGKTSDFVYSEANDRMSSLGVFPLKFPIHADCSAFVTLCYWLAGCADPNGGTAYNGTNYGREGYTGTLLGHGIHITPQQLQPGDVVVYGATPGVHTAIVVQVINGAKGQDVLTVSHGGPTGQSPIYCWVNKPVNEISTDPVDGRTPQTYLRFTTAAVNTVHTPPAA